MFIKGFLSEPLNHQFDKYFSKINNIRIFYRFRNFIDSNGIRYSSFAKRNYNLRIMNNNIITKFGNVLLQVNSSIATPPTTPETGWILPDGSFNRNVLRYDFDTDINDSKSAICKAFVSLFEECYENFLEREEDISKQKKIFGNSTNDLLISLGASYEEQQAYWKNINEKCLLSPLQFLGYLKVLDTIFEKNSIGYEVILDSLSVTRYEDYKKYGLSFLPKDIKVSKWILQSYAESRFSYDSELLCQAI